MLYIFDKKSKEVLPCEETNFKDHNILERRDIENWLINCPEVLGEELFIITTEYNKFYKQKKDLTSLPLIKMEN